MNPLKRIDRTNGSGTTNDPRDGVVCPEVRPRACDTPFSIETGMVRPRVYGFHEGSPGRHGIRASAHARREKRTGVPGWALRKGEEDREERNPSERVERMGERG